MIQYFLTFFILRHPIYLIVIEEINLFFRLLLKKYAVNIDKKGNAHIKFSTRTAVDYFNFKIEVYSNGSAKNQCHYATQSKCQFLGRIKYVKRRDEDSFFIVIIFFNIMREVILIFILVSIAQLFYGQEKYTIQGELPDHSLDNSYFAFNQ